MPTARTPIRRRSPNYLGWIDPKSLLAVSFDYAGLANETIEDLSGGDISLGTEVSGKVIERSLADGRTEVHVILHTDNALTWAFEFDFSSPNAFNTQPLLFGARVTDVLDGATPSLGHSRLDVTFITTADLGDPLPDLLQVVFAPEEGQELRSLSFRGSATGELREEFGVPDGTRGMVDTTQVGLFHTAFKGATADGFPVERVSIREIGNGAGSNNAPAASSASEAAWAEALNTFLAGKGKKTE